MGERRYIQIPGTETHELPPLLIRRAPDCPAPGDILELAEDIVETEHMLPESPVEDGTIGQRKFELALNLAEQYKGLIAHWQWGDSILEWIRQCEITFETREMLRNLLHPDVWPHGGRASFVMLLVDKSVPTHGVVVQKAVGLRLTFRQPPPIGCFSNQFLFYLNSPVAGIAYQTWARLTPDSEALFPPDRFHFQVFDMAEQQ